MKRLRIASGTYKVRYIGIKVGFRSIHLCLSNDPEVRVPETKYSLFVHEKHAFEFGYYTSPTATIQEAQAELTAAGYDTEIEEIDSHAGPKRAQRPRVHDVA